MRELAKQALYSALVAIEVAIDTFYVGTDPQTGHDPLTPSQRRALNGLQQRKQEITDTLSLLVKADQLEEDVELAGTGSIDDL